MARDDFPVRRRPAFGGAAAVLGLVGVLGLLPACGGGGQEASSVEDSLGLDTEGIAVRQARVENLIRDCMRAEGFEYVPVDPAAQRAALTGAADMSEDDFHRQFGYGITTLYEKRATEAAGSPNVAIRRSLSPAQQSAYDRALYGSNVGLTFDVAVDQDLIGQLGGCTRAATEEVFGGPELLSTVAAKVQELDERIVSDPRMVKAIGEWSRCMRAAGFDLAEPEQVDVVLRRKLEQVVGPPDQGGPPAAFDRAALIALQREEIAMVAADVTCERRHITPVEDRVRAEYERSFRQQNAVLFERVPRP